MKFLMNSFFAKHSRHLLLLLPLALAGCAAGLAKPELPAPLRAPQAADTREAALPKQAPAPGLRTESAPSAPAGGKVVAGLGDDRGPGLQGPPLTVNFDSLPLPAFIDQVFGDLLGLSYQLAPALEKQKDRVTLRVVEPQTPDELYRLAEQVLADYGVVIQEEAGLLKFEAGKAGAVTAPPLLVTGEALPGVPPSHRPVFQLMPLKVVRNTQVTGWLRSAYGKELEVKEDPERNAVLLKGKPALVAQAAEAVQLLDQPVMRGRHSLRIEPAFQDAATLAKNLVDVLQSQGYAASLRPPTGSVIVLPIPEVNVVIAFAADREQLAHVRRWAGQLDRPNLQGAEEGFFYYAVQNTRAEELAKIVTGLLGSVPAEAGDKKSAAPRAAARTLVVDENRNGLIFRGAAEVWARILPVIQEMDQPPKQVLVEVTIAEVTLTDQEELGVEWLIENLDLGSYTGTLGTLGGLGLGEQGLNFTVDSAGQTRALLNAFAANDRVSILSSPRVMVKSGQEATIDVGSEVPIITSQATSAELQEGGTSAILQQVQYRKTGVLLNVKPVVHAGRRVDLDISQEVSEAQPNTTSNVSSPSIFTRRLQTNLSLRDGGSVLLGGLISRSASRGNAGVPGLRELPAVGKLFGADKHTQTRTELMLIIVPYVLNDAEEAEDITNAFRAAMRIVE